MTELIKYIEYNNYDKLQQFIDNIKNISIKDLNELIVKSVVFRSYECFELLLDEYDISKCITVLQNALHIYKNAPNSRNYYFVEKLLEKKVYVNSTSLDYSTIDENLFNKILLKANKYAINEFIIYHNITDFKYDYKIFNYVESFDDTEDNNIIYSLILKAIKNDNIEMLLFLQSKNINLLTINNKATLNYIFDIEYKHEISFVRRATINFLLDLYTNLSYEEINIIDDITKLNHFYKNNLVNFKTELQKYVKLNINFTEVVKNLIINNINFINITYSTNYTFLLFTLFKTNKVNINLIIVYLNENDILYEYNIMKNKIYSANIQYPNFNLKLANDTIKINNIIDKIMNLLFIFSYFKIDVFSINNIKLFMQDTFRKSFTFGKSFTQEIDIASFEKLKENYIKQMYSM